MKKKVQILLFIFCIYISATAKQNPVVETFKLKSSPTSLIPDRFIGNWINSQTCIWEYGFFEKFAIYRSEFWDYKAIETDKNGNTNLTLVKDNETLQLMLKEGKDNHITVQTTKGKALLYNKMEKVYPCYPQKDESTFAKPTFKQDSATIIGYYRNLNKIPAQFAGRLSKNPFKVSVSNFLADKQLDYVATFDSLGRFRITFPLMNMQELFVDWKRINIQMMLEPGSTIFLYVDLADYIPLAEDKGMDGFLKRPKQVLFMGDNALTNNELFKYKSPSLYINQKKSEKLNDMGYLSYCDSVYKQRLADLNTFITNNPTVSEKFRLFTTEKERYNLAFYLLQHRFDLRRKGKTKFDDGYIDYVQANFPLNNEWTFTAFRDFRSFLRDYIDYLTGLAPQKTVTILYKDMAKYIKQNKKVDDSALKLLDELITAYEEFENSNKDQVEALQIKHKDLFSKAKTINPLFQEASAEMTANLPIDTHLSDSLLTNEHLRQLWNACIFYKQLDDKHVALSEETLKVMRTKVVNPYLIKEIENVSNFYKNVSTKGLTYEASLKSTENLKGFKDAKVLFEELIKPYKGKVIYVDFWGTWCGPCKENMKYVKDIKNKLKDQDVVFMYFANNSAETSWKNVIKEMDLTGENVIHYRLPDNQEKLIEQLFSVNKFPTYLLVNKEGKVVNMDATSPKQGDVVIKQITELLK
ncbi:MAG TPA: TlpA disulfide reductase family protein [Paludibacter sp.]